MNVIGSPDITNLDVEVTWNISGNSPYISLVNLSQGAGLANVDWWIEAFSPTNTPIHEGSATEIDMTGDWSTKSITDAWPRPNYAIEWSGPPYSLTLFARDSNGKVYSVTKTRMIGRPNGVISGSKSMFGIAQVYLKVKCEQGRVYFEDRTNATYNGVIGTRIDAVLAMSYPVDENANQIPAFKANNFTNALVPISFSAPSYSYTLFSVYEYSYGDGTKVRIKYFGQETFAVMCNIELSQLFCDIQKLNEEVQYGRCENMGESLKKLTLINNKYASAVLGKIEPLSGIDVSKLIDEIKEIGGFSCTCISPDAGIINQTASSVDGYTFDVVHVGGDINGQVVAEGPIIHIKLSDKTYVFAMWQGSPSDTTAFSIVPDTSSDGFTKYFYLKTDTYQLAVDLAGRIKNNSYLLNLWQEIGGGVSERNFVVDGRCVFQSTSTFDYNFVVKNIPASGTFAILSEIKVGGVGRNLNFNFNLANTTALQTYLNTLNIGAFVVTKPSSNPGSIINIASTSNANVLDSLQYSISGTTYTADVTKSATGYVPVKDNVVIDNIIKYICGLSDTQMVTSEEYVITYVDANNAEQSFTVEKGKSLNFFIENLLKYNTNNIQILRENSGFSSCEDLQELFTANTGVPTASDFIFATKGGGSCSKVGYLDVFNYMLSQAKTNATTMNLICGVIQQCGAGAVAEPFDYLEPIVTVYSTTCSPIVGIEYVLA